MRSASHIIAIGEGKILEQGSFEELNSRAGYFSIFINNYTE
jgi:ABC-type multidrug transport system fused ATPase/permease subunit